MVNNTNNITLAKINNTFANELVKILNTDNKLQDSLGAKKSNISHNEFIIYNNHWSKVNNAEIFAILYKEIAIGTISLSHQNIKLKKAEIGYWISSKYWKKGYTSEAFSQILNYAKSKGIKHLSSKIKKDNIPSRKIWINKGSKIELIDDYFFVSMML
ncbi:GNAT family N-acetyltransferase [Clostridium sp. ATCC 25772]|uniref:GNAT family N-acetyltransferase n=1 Tax=Clostridium senegalense TaxID=1465809 RepID=A0A6M0H3A0_9CLOT|nr:GNAT family N-acetyltransferase [Clostridium sp. ATCC 25772]NEU05240.1 GNAT family N-acetyltransferase [Clostridium senegalense]